MENKFESILKNLASPHSINYLEHNPEKCGQCAREVITQQVAQDFLLQNRTADTEITAFYQEIDRRWHQHPIYLKIKHYQSQGLSLQEALKKALDEDDILG